MMKYCLYEEELLLRETKLDLGTLLQMPAMDIDILYINERNKIEEENKQKMDKKQSSVPLKNNFFDLEINKSR